MSAGPGKHLLVPVERTLPSLLYSLWGDHRPYLYLQIGVYVVNIILNLVSANPRYARTFATTMISPHLGQYDGSDVASGYAD